MISASHVRRVECNWIRELLLRHLEGKLMCRKREREKEREETDLVQRNRDGRQNVCTALQVCGRHCLITLDSWSTRKWTRL